MYTVDQTIDTIQNSKKQFVGAVVKNDAIAKSLNEFVDAQTVFARQAGHDAPLHQAQATGLDHGMELARNQVAGTGQQVSQVVVDKSIHGCRLRVVPNWPA